MPAPTLPITPLRGSRTSGYVFIARELPKVSEHGFAPPQLGMKMQGDGRRRKARIIGRGQCSFLISPGTLNLKHSHPYASIRRDAWNPRWEVGPSALTGWGATHQPASELLTADTAACVLHAACDVENQLPQPLLPFQILTGDLAVCANMGA